MIDAKCIEDNKVSYVPAKDIETHNIKMDKDGFITFYNSTTHKFYRSELPWKNGLEDFVEFVDHEVNSAEIERAS